MYFPENYFLCKLQIVRYYIKTFIPKYNTPKQNRVLKDLLKTVSLSSVNYICTVRIPYSLFYRGL